jgi:hypothetical protein
MDESTRSRSVCRCGSSQQRGGCLFQRFGTASDQATEEIKAEATWILEAIKTLNPDKGAENLEFLLKTGLIRDKTTRAGLERYLKERQPGKGPALPPVRGTMNALEPSDTASGSGCVCTKP